MATGVGTMNNQQEQRNKSRVQTNTFIAELKSGLYNSERFGNSQNRKAVKETCYIIFTSWYHKFVTRIILQVYDVWHSGHWNVWQGHPPMVTWATQIHPWYCSKITRLLRRSGKVHSQSFPEDTLGPVPGRSHYVASKQESKQAIHGDFSSIRHPRKQGMW